jgi:hypothetical protein
MVGHARILERKCDREIGGSAPSLESISYLTRDGAAGKARTELWHRSALVF